MSAMAAAAACAVLAGLLPAAGFTAGGRQCEAAARPLPLAFPSAAKALGPACPPVAPQWSAAGIVAAAAGGAQAAALFATAASRRGRVGRRRGGGGGASFVVRAASTGGEASKLERDAAQLRAEAAELERAKAGELRAARARQLLGVDGGIGDTIGAEALAARVKEVVGITLSAGQVNELMAMGTAGGGQLGFDDLASVSFDEALARFRAADDARIGAELARRQQELADEAEREKFVSSVTDLFTADADDGGLPGRALACLPYLLPLADGLPYGGGLAGELPFIYALLSFFGPLNFLKEAVPFGTFLFLIGFQILYRNRELPSLLRYNLRQACVIDILLVLPQFLAGITGIQLPGIEIPLFILMALSVGYSLVLTALGKQPSGLGFISDATERDL